MPASASTWQRRALLLGALLDAAFALAMLVVPAPSSRLLALALPADPTWFRLCGVLLLIVAGCYAVAARAPEPMPRRVGAVAGAGRLLGCAVLVHAGLTVPSGTALLLTGVLDGALGLAHVGLAARGPALGPERVDLS